MDNVFYAQTKNPLWKVLILVVPGIKYVCFAAQIKFCCESGSQCTYGSKKVVWYGNNGSHVSRDHIKEMGMALHPRFPDLLSIFKLTW